MLRRNLGLILWTSALVTVLGLAAAPARADDMFLQLGDIQGESTARGHEKWIDIVSWSWGVTNPTTVGAGNIGLTAGRANVAELNLMKFADSATPRLLDAACKGTHFPAATLAVRRSSDGLEYLKIRIEEISVTSVQLSTGGERPAESVGLSFARVVVDYIPTLGKPRITYGWDVTGVAPFSLPPAP
jgi:type VI secretion system secreted protein Hcp